MVNTGRNQEKTAERGVAKIDNNLSRDWKRDNCSLCGHENIVDSEYCPNCYSKLENQQRRQKKLEVWFNIAKEVSTLATCNRLNVGAVVVNNNRIIGTGYNGAPSGLSHCDEKGHLMVDGHCRRVIHAEANALLSTPDKELVGADLFCTHQPCSDCFLKIAQSEVDRVLFLEKYDNLDFDYMEMAKEKNMVVGYFHFDSPFCIDVLSPKDEE